MPIRSDQAQMLFWAAVGLVLLWGLYLLGPVLTRSEEHTSELQSR